MTTLDWKQRENNLEELGSYAPLPRGDYDVEIMTTEVKQSKSSPWKYLEVKFAVIGNKYKNRLVFERYLIEHPDSEKDVNIKKTITITYNKLHKLFVACDLKDEQNPKKLEGKELSVSMEIEEPREKKDGSGYWPANNRISITRALDNSVKSTVEHTIKSTTPSNDFKDDEIPF